MNNLKTFIVSLILWVPLLFLVGSVVYAQANKVIGPDVCRQAPTSEVCKEARAQGTTDPISGPGGLISDVANIVAIIAGIVAVIVIIISGIMYATAGGAPGGQRAGDSPNSAKKAQAALTGAIIGLILIALAWSITRFIVDRVVQ